MVWRDQCYVYRWHLPTDTWIYPTVLECHVLGQYGLMFSTCVADYW